jgi:CheY-like chemotaxis protein
MPYRRSEMLVIGITLLSYALILFAWLMTNASPAFDTGAVVTQPIVVVLATAIAAIIVGAAAAWWAGWTSGRRDTTIRLLLAADSDPVRCAIRELVEESQAITVTGEARNCHELVYLLREAEPKPDVVLMDLDMPGESSFSADAFKSHLGNTRLLAMSLWDGPQAAALAESYGAVKLVDKNDLGSNLVPAIQDCSHPN